MSISVDGRIKEKIDDQLLEKYLNIYFCADLECEIYFKDGLIFCKCDKFVLNVFFVIDKDPNNIWDSDILCEEYEYSQAIMFDVRKESDYDFAYKCIVGFFLYLYENISCEILVTSNVFDDICYINDNGIYWSERWLNRYNKLI